MNKWFDVDEKTIGINYRSKDRFVTLMFDKEDYPLVSQYRFCICTSGYAQCKKGKTKDNWIMAHNLIMNPPEGFEVDHIYGNRLDNRKGNLRICTHLQNQKNRRSKKKYMGVYKDNFTIPRTVRYYTQIKINGKNKHIAYCKTEKEAAMAYNEAAKKYYGEFACLNIID